MWIFDLEPRPAGITTGELDDMAKFVQPALLGKVHASQVDDDLKTLWEVILEEAGNKSWMRGPLSVEACTPRGGFLSGGLVFGSPQETR